MKCLLFFSDFLLSNEISRCTDNKSTTIFFIHALLLSYKPVKVYRNDMDHPVLCHFDTKLKKNNNDKQVSLNF